MPDLRQMLIWNRTLNWFKSVSGATALPGRSWSACTLAAFTTFAIASRANVRNPKI